MTNSIRILATLVSLLLCSLGIARPGTLTFNKPNSIYSKWENGPSQRDDYFMIGVWLQDPAKATEYKEIGINTYVGLWKGPTQKHLEQLKEADMKVICLQNDVGLENIKNETIIGWMQPDEPDNGHNWELIRAFIKGKREDYSPAIPEKLYDKYQEIMQNDPTRPIFLNLGQGVANDNWKGRGSRRGHPEDYYEYVQCGDIISFDIYPMAHKDKKINGDLSYLAKGLKRLKKYTSGKKTIYNIVEAVDIRNRGEKLTPELIRSEVWMSIIHGSQGIIYFVHQWEPKFKEAALLDNLELKDAVESVNQEIIELVPVLNEPAVSAKNDWLVVKTKNEDTHLKVLHKRYKGASYIFAIEMTGQPTRAYFNLTRVQGDYSAHVLGEHERIEVKNGKFDDYFDPWQVHIYRIETPTYDRGFKFGGTSVGGIKTEKH